MNVRSIVSRLLLALALAGAIAWALMHRDQLNPADLQQQIQHLGPWAPLAFIGLFALATVLFLPAAIFGLIGGAVRGGGAGLNPPGPLARPSRFHRALRFGLGRDAPVAPERADRRVSRRLAFCGDGPSGAIVSVQPAQLALGLTRIRLSHYVLASLVAMIPGTVAYAWLGHAGREVAAGSETAVRNLLLALGLLAVVAFRHG
jgi:uncharacterized membrane protein YdjX (TVP38/TMEM64 family)